MGAEHGLKELGQRRFEYHRSFGRHCGRVFSTIVVSIIENGAGSVDVSARPALPNTRSTSGKTSARGPADSSSCACATEIPGSVVGM